MKNPNDKTQNSCKQDRLTIPPKKADLPGVKVNMANPSVISDEVVQEEQSTTPYEAPVYVEDFVYENNPADYILPSENIPCVAGGQNSDLHEIKVNMNYIEEQEVGYITDLPTANFRMATVQLSEYSDEDKSDNSILSSSTLTGQCFNCEELGPLGLYCNTCEGTGFIYESIPNYSSSLNSSSSGNSVHSPTLCYHDIKLEHNTDDESNNSVQHGTHESESVDDELPTGSNNNDKATQCNFQMSLKQIIIQLCNLCNCCGQNNKYDLPPPTTCTSLMNIAAIGDLRQSKQFDNVRLWMAALPLHFYITQNMDIECHWDGGSNSNIFTKKEYFFVLQPIQSQVTQVSGATAVCEGIGIVIIKIPKTDITLPLYPSYYAPKFPQNTISLNAIKHYNKYRSVK